MRLLLDTHALAWWWIEDKRLPQAARAAIADPDNTMLVSAATAWELATKHRLGKWPDVAAIVGDLDALLRRSRFGALAITLAHARLAGTLDGPHRDPFDRMLIAQCRQEALPIVSADPVFARYKVPVIWHP
jgi:PIN domain nuclease of toxin-antitoxin system